MHKKILFVDFLQILRKLIKLFSLETMLEIRIQYDVKYSSKTKSAISIN